MFYEMKCILMFDLSAMIDDDDNAVDEKDYCEDIDDDD